VEDFSIQLCNSMSFFKFLIKQKLMILISEMCFHDFSILCFQVTFFQEKILMYNNLLRVVVCFMWYFELINFLTSFIIFNLHYCFEYLTIRDILTIDDQHLLFTEEIVWLCAFSFTFGTWEHRNCLFVIYYISLI
jgi:hypothetical protein